MIISPAATAPQPEQPSDSLPWTPISDCLWIQASHYLSSPYGSTLSASLMLLRLWKHAVTKAAVFSTQQHTWTHTVHHIHVDNPSPGPCNAPAIFTPTDTWTHYTLHKYTHLPGHQTVLTLSQGSQQRRFEGWIKARIIGDSETDEPKQALQDGASS